MRHVVVPESLSQNGPLDSEKFGWRHTQLAPEAFRRLSNGMEGLCGGQDRARSQKKGEKWH